MLSRSLAVGVSPADMLKIKQHLRREGSERQLIRRARQLRLPSMRTLVSTTMKRTSSATVHPEEDG